MNSWSISCQSFLRLIQIDQVLFAYSFFITRLLQFKAYRNFVYFYPEYFFHQMHFAPARLKFRFKEKLILNFWWSACQNVKNDGYVNKKYSNSRLASHINTS